MKRDSLNTSILFTLHFQSRGGMLNQTGGTYSHSGMMGCLRIPISELNLGEMPCLDGIVKAGKSTSSTEVLFKNSRSSDHNALDQRS